MSWHRSVCCTTENRRCRRSLGENRNTILLENNCNSYSWEFIAPTFASLCLKTVKEWLETQTGLPSYYNSDRKAKDILGAIHQDTALLSTYIAKTIHQGKCLMLLMVSAPPIQLELISCPGYVNHIHVWLAIMKNKMVDWIGLFATLKTETDNQTTRWGWFIKWWYDLRTL